MKKKNDTTGKKFGTLTVIEEISVPFLKPKEKRKTKIKCKCKCTCGNISYVWKTNLITNKSKSCKFCQNLKDDIINKKFGFLTVLKRDINSAAWKCKCKCGNIVLVSRKNLINKHRLACYDCQPKRCNLNYVFEILADKKIKFKRIKFLKFEDKKAIFLATCPLCKQKIKLTGNQLRNNKSCGCSRAVCKSGESNSHAKLTNEEASLIRSLKKENPELPLDYFSKTFKISEWSLRDLLNNKTYKD